MSGYMQDTRRIAIATPVGENVLLLRGFSGEEGISQLFHFDLDLLSTNDAIDFSRMVGENVTIRVSLAGSKERYFNGIISRFSQGGRDSSFTYYSAEMVPWPWLLTRTADCRIFQNQTVPQIIQKVFDDNKCKDYSLAGLKGSFEPREYCVQYRESDFNFVSRLMEEEGMYYFFTHVNGKHTMMLANTPEGHPDCPSQSTVRYHYAGAAKMDEDMISDWHTSQHVRTGTYTLNDFNFEDPNASLIASKNGRNPLEVYDYPGEYRRQPEGESYARIRLEECETPRIKAQGAGDCRGFTSGHKFNLTDHYRPDQNKTYVLTRIRHFVSLPGDFRATSSADSGDTMYQNSFECIPLSTPFRPTRVTPKPVIQGTQTAIVVGKKGEEITTDKYGRVKVQFHWDREGRLDENSSCWIRVSQPWAGKTWGAVSIPRVGQEVVVDFLEGDPDRPLVTGRVYNAEQMPPYDLPGGADMMGFKSNSTKGGGGYNEIVIRDGKANELIRIHGQKDMETLILHDQKEMVKNHKNLHVLKELRTRVDEKVSHTVNGDLAEHFTKNHAEVVDAERYLKAKRIIIEAEQEICIKVGGNHVHISGAGVYVEGTMVDLNCGHPAQSTTIGGLTPTQPEDPVGGPSSGPSPLKQPLQRPNSSKAVKAVRIAGAAGATDIAASNLVPAKSAKLLELENAKKMAALAQDVYNSQGEVGLNRLSDDPNALPPLLQDFPFKDPVSGFDSALYETPEGKIVVAYRGTEDKKDWKTNLKQAAGFKSEQYDLAVRLAKGVQRAYPGRAIEITGHSLGGGLGQVASAVTGLPATTFNAAGVREKTFARYKTDKYSVNVVNYAVQGEVLTGLQASSLIPAPAAAGLTKTLEARDQDGIPLSGGPLARHSMTSVQQSLDYAIQEEQKQL